MTFEQYINEIDSMWTTGNGWNSHFSETIDKCVNGMKLEYDRLLARNNQLLIENAELEKRIEELE